MLRAYPAALLLSLAAAAPAQTAPAQTAAKPTVEPAQSYILRSGQVTMCQLDKGCKEETMGGRKYLIMATDGFVLKVASGTDARHGYADITITNQTGTPQQVNPTGFRMEESEPRLHRLFYVDPTRQQEQPDQQDHKQQRVMPREQDEEKPVKLSAPKGLPPPDYWTSRASRAPQAEEPQVERKPKAKPKPAPALQSTVPLLRPGTIAPDGTVSGRVYFERPHAARGVSLLLALPGALFEFPCQFPTAAKNKKHSKHEAAAEPAEAQS